MCNSEFKSWLLSARERYANVKKFMDESKNDPPNEPYRSKYKAREILQALVAEIETKWKSIENLRMIVLYAGFKYDLGVIALETEEISDGCELLESSCEKIKDCSGKPESCTLSLNVLNQLGILWSSRGEPLKALSFLDEAVKVYNLYKKNYGTSNDIYPYNFEDLFNVSEEENYVTSPYNFADVSDISDKKKCDWTSLEKAFTHTLYYLAQVHEHLNDSDKAAKYCHQTLKRQMDSGEFEANDWAINCATLSQYYIQNKMFYIAKHLLACSSYVLEQHESRLNVQDDNKDLLDELCCSKAEVSWCWLKYCINLLLESQSLHVDEESENGETTSCRLSNECDILMFEARVRSNVSTYEEARSVFLFGQDKVQEAKQFYTLHHHANNHVRIVQDYSKLYNCLTYFEHDLSRQCKMHKRRIDMLEAVLKQLNPQYYLAVCRQLQFELGETYYEMVDLKHKQANSDTITLSMYNVKKINSLISYGIHHFNSFIDSLRDHDGNLPPLFADDLIRPALIAHFYLGSLFTKLVETEISKKLSNMSKSEECYKFVLEYIEKNPSHKNYIEKEFSVIKEMVQLMPERKIQVTGSTIF